MFLFLRSFFIIIKLKTTQNINRNITKISNPNRFFRMLKILKYLRSYGLRFRYLKPYRTQIDQCLHSIVKYCATWNSFFYCQDQHEHYSSFSLFTTRYVVFMVHEDICALISHRQIHFKLLRYWLSPVTV